VGRERGDDIGGETKVMVEKRWLGGKKIFGRKADMVGE
jgi:hypothetical protein